jgi:hypothetical protein
MAIPTKKKKSAKMVTDLGPISAYKTPGYIRSSFDVRRESPQDADKRLGRISIPASPREPRLVCRALVKIAIGSFANLNSVDVFGKQFDDARQFARFNNPKTKWWYAEHVDLNGMKSALKLGAAAHKERIRLETMFVDDIPAFFHLKLFFLDILTPIEPRIRLRLPEDLPEGTRFYRV